MGRRQRLMSKKKKSARSGYPYKILPFSGDPSKIGTPPPISVNEYFLIEALLRSEKVMEAYRQGGEQALITKFREYGIVGHNPLHGSHHGLLSEPVVDKEWGEKIAQLGQVDMGLGILDLGILATLPPNVNVHHGNLMLCGANDGLADCLAYLRNSNPRFLCLRIDTSHPVETIITRLRDLLRERNKQATKVPLHGIFEFYARLEKTPFRKIKAWLEYIQCYDLFKSGKTTEAAGEQVYDGSVIASEKANTAVRRVKALIKHAEAVASEQEQANKERIKKPKKNRILWPPHHIP
jgi:hypothetical protein